MTLPVVLEAVTGLFQPVMEGVSYTAKRKPLVQHSNLDRIYGQAG